MKYHNKYLKLPKIKISVVSHIESLKTLQNSLVKFNIAFKRNVKYIKSKAPCKKQKQKKKNPPKKSKNLLFLFFISF